MFPGIPFFSHLREKTTAGKRRHVPRLTSLHPVRLRRPRFLSASRSTVPCRHHPHYRKDAARNASRAGRAEVNPAPPASEGIFRENMLCRVSHPNLHRDYSFPHMPVSCACHCLLRRRGV
ncbi:MAG: hypothetical protein DBY37_14055 [Desulfovibrionaceae bacterium]|nr:MAG: hypothetical protein DBY37_14055 [Desulfovibrionaceae bacterium]